MIVVIGSALGGAASPRGAGTGEQTDGQRTAQTHHNGTKARKAQKTLYIGLSAALILSHFCINDRFFHFGNIW